MRKNISRMIAVMLACVLIVFSALPVFAEAVYVVNGYSYNILNNTSIALCGWDNSTVELIVPNMIAERTVVSVADYGLKYNTEITSVDFTETEQLQYIGIEAFCGCAGIASEITIPATVTTIRERAFQECSSLPSVVINAATTTIPKQCFYQCSSMESVVLPESLTTISAFAFANCTSLESVIIPSSVSSIDSTAFKNDSNLVLGVYKDTYGLQYAVDNNINYYLLDGAMLGDADRSGYISINDVTTIQRHIAEFDPLNGIYLYASDINRNGEVDIDDATELQRFLAEFQVDHPIGEIFTQ